ncbi:hypothetical protein QGM71_01250 [Virgibacillus sp. C22-A2]|uniref:Phage protein n=1 Tax=Virgibacillus tibetensis TaxID=3042313 RepID=A0ABU6KAJ7_9BACI|nr:hypothetical protein [Virgibacillus sp. C22-A2]
MELTFKEIRDELVERFNVDEDVIGEMVFEETLGLVKLMKVQKERALKESVPVKKKFILEFDEEPSFLYVSHGHNKEKVFLHGKEVEHWTGLEMRTSVDDFMTYDISYVDAPKNK